jgi:hypothetical protein
MASISKAHMDKLTISLAILKGFGLLATGVFGIIGAVTNFKDQDGNLTKWGKRNLAGLVIGLVMALTSQCIEYVRGRNEATAAADRAKKAADQAELMLKNTTTAATKISEVGKEIEAVSKEASTTAKELGTVDSNIERTLDPLEPVVVSASFGIPLPGEIVKNDIGTESNDLSQYVAYRKQLEAVKVEINPDDESGPAIYICRLCPEYPSNSQPRIVELFTDKYELYFGFLAKTASGKYPSLDSDNPQMGFWVDGQPEINEKPDEDGPTPHYFINEKTIALYLNEKTVDSKDFFSPRSSRSIRDLLGKRMYIEIRTHAEGSLPASIRNNIHLSLINVTLPGRRTLQFHDRNMIRANGRTDARWYFDFPDTMEQLQRLFAP